LEQYLRSSKTRAAELSFVAPCFYNAPRLSSIRVTERLNSENWKEIELNYCGTQVKGTYKISDRLMTVVYGSRTKTAKLGILPADMLAHMLLRELEFERRETKRNTLGE
jgi:hypothetical protein